MRDHAAILPGFDYGQLDRVVAERVRSGAARIRERVKRSVGAIIEVGDDLCAVKGMLPHGDFRPWLRAEFGWTERTARNFMAVAERFGPKAEMISDLAISPTAAYLLAAPSAPDEARQAAVERAAAGEQITTAVARQLLAAARKKAARVASRFPFDELRPKLTQLLQRYKAQCRPEDFRELARGLREFADTLVRNPRAGK
jgi:hypothetical protein